MRLLSSACAIVATQALAYPIPPQGLWELTANSELVVIATVELGPPGTALPTSFAKAAQWTPTSREPVVRLRVIETLKGVPAELVEVLRDPGMIYPAPSRFEEGKKVLAFLEGAHGRWHVVARSYGTLYPSEDELPVFAERIREAVKLQASSFTNAQRIDWAVRTTARRATRWHGAVELARPSAPNLFSRSVNRQVTSIDEKQRQLLASGFVAEPSADSTTPKIAQLLSGHTDPRFDRALIGAVNTLLEGTDSLSAFDAMDQAIARAGGTRRALMAGINPSAWEHDMSTLRSAWAKAKKELKLPEGAYVPRGDSVTSW